MKFFTILMMIMVSFLSVSAFAEECPLGDAVIISETRTTLYDCISYNEKLDLWEGINGNRKDYYTPDKVIVENGEGIFFRRWKKDSHGKKVGRIFFEENSPWWIISRENEEFIRVDSITYDVNRKAWIAFTHNAKGETIETRYPSSDYEAYGENGRLNASDYYPWSLKDRAIYQQDCDKKNSGRFNPEEADRQEFGG